MYFCHHKIFVPTYEFAYFYLIQMTQPDWVLSKKAELTQAGDKKKLLKFL